ncbi:MAG: ABC transporter substrate-binding protein [Acidimicrobiales bacterium]
MSLRVALVGGPMYDGLYRSLGLFDEVEVIVHADHPTLNRELARRLGAGERLDLIATHSKYAPSQAAWLTPLEESLDEVDLDAFAERALALCRWQGRLLSLPRNIDVRTLWVDADAVPAVPTTWTDLDASGLAFGFTGRDSGLFGTFFEVVTAWGGRLFTPDGTPALVSDVAGDALTMLRRLAGRLPESQAEWHYDDVDIALGAGVVPMAAAWPGGTAALRATTAGPRLRPHPYFDGISYSGCHSWAIPTTCGDLPGAVALLGRLGSATAHRVDAVAGTVPARTDVLAAIQPADAVDAARWDVLRRTIADGMITYPPLNRFPEIEDACWSTIRDVLVGRTALGDALGIMQAAAIAACA